MLVLTRKENETIRIGDDIVITLVKTQGGSVRIGIDAPKEVKILRGELEPCDAASMDVDVYQHGQPVIAGQTRDRLPMANTLEPVRSELVSRKCSVARTSAGASTLQTVSA